MDRSSCWRRYDILYECVNCESEVGSCCLNGILCTHCFLLTSDTKARCIPKAKVASLQRCQQCCVKALRRLTCPSCKKLVGLCCYAGNKCKICLDKKTFLMASDLLKGNPGEASNVLKAESSVSTAVYPKVALNVLKGASYDSNTAEPEVASNVSNMTV